MLLDFDIDKAIAATAHVIERKGGNDDMFCLIKKLYYADRAALIQWGKSITGDKLASLQKGPIVNGHLQPDERRRGGARSNSLG